MHKQQGWPQAWEYSQTKLIQTLVRASQGVDWSWSQCIKSHHAKTSSGKGLPSTNVAVESDFELSADLVSVNAKSNFEPSVCPMLINEPEYDLSSCPVSVSEPVYELSACPVCQWACLWTFCLSSLSVNLFMYCLPVQFQSVNLFMNCLPVQFQSMSLLMNCLPVQSQSVSLLMSFLCSLPQSLRPYMHGLYLLSQFSLGPSICHGSMLHLCQESGPFLSLRLPPEVALPSYWLSHCTDCYTIPWTTFPIIHCADYTHSCNQSNTL